MSWTEADTTTETTTLRYQIDTVRVELAQCVEAIRVRDGQLLEAEYELGKLHARNVLLSQRIQRLQKQVEILASGCASKKRRERELALAACVIVL